MKARVKINTESGTMLEMDLWELVMSYFYIVGIYAHIPHEEMHLYLNGEEVEKSTEMEEEQ